MLLIYILLFLVSCLVIAQAGTWVINYLIKIGLFLKWKKIVFPFVLFGLMASLPVLFVSIGAAISAKPELALGSIIGANIILLTLVTGGISFLSPTKGLKIKGKTLRRTLAFAVLYALLPLLLLLNKEASRIDGIILIVAFGLYIKEFICQQARLKEKFIEEPILKEEKPKSISNPGLKFLLSAALLILSAQAIVFSAVRVNFYFGAPLFLMGTLGVALGVSLPEIIFGIRSVILRQKDVIPGIIFFPIIINSTLVLGLVFLISPIRQIYHLPLYINSLIFTGLAASALLLFSKTKEEISRREAKFLLFFYVLFFVVQLLI
jgi:cation:H+ antiporter